MSIIGHILGFLGAIAGYMLLVAIPAAAGPFAVFYFWKKPFSRVGVISVFVVWWLIVVMAIYGLFPDLDRLHQLCVGIAVYGIEQILYFPVMDIMKRS